MSILSVSKEAQPCTHNYSTCTSYANRNA